MLLLTGVTPSVADARPCKPHPHYRHGHPHPKSGFSLSFSFGHPHRFHHPGHRFYPPRHHFYRPRTVYRVPRQTAYRSTSVARAQATLNAIGYASGPVDGIMGPQTRAAITRFQAASGLPATGRLDAATSQRLSEFR